MYTDGKLSSWRFGIAKRTKSENEILKTYSRFSKVTWPSQKCIIITQKVLIAQKSFCTRFRREKRGFIGFLFMFLPKPDGKVVKNGKTLKKAISLFSGKGHNSDILGKKYVNFYYLYLNSRCMEGFYSAFSPKVKRFSWMRNAWFFKKN